jgi:signal transduction histidine kinase
MSRHASPENAGTFEDLISLLMEQQARIREFVTTMSPKPASLEAVPLARPLGETVNALRRQWKCEIHLEVYPSEAAVTAQRQLQLRLIVSEAVANAVKHGRATRVDLSVGIEGVVSLAVQDNGQVGQAQSTETPYSIVRRVQDAGGTCTFQRNDVGGLLTATIPEH